MTDLPLVPILPFGIRMLGIILAYTGYRLILDLSFISIAAGFVLWIAGGLLLAVHFRVKLDIDNWRYKKYLWIFGITAGKWVSMTDYQKVLIRKHVYQSYFENLPFFGYNPFAKPTYDLLLVSGDSENLIIGSGSHKKMLSAGNQIAQKMNIPVDNG
jgi:hypothetical protein